MADDELNGYEGRYRITRDGKVYSIRKKLYLRPSFTSGKYHQVKLYDGKESHPKNVHRLVAETYLPPPIGPVEVNHKDGNKLNNAVSNLEWCTKSENTQHAYDTGLRFAAFEVGSKHANAKLVEEDIADIRMFSDKGVSLANIAKVYPITKASVWKIVKHRSWRHA